jgi:sulfur-carrier protein
MSVTVHIPGPLRDFSQQRGEVQLAGSPATLLEALRLLWATYPGLRDRILTEEGQLREHINIFVGNESIRYTGGLATPLSPNATISIIPAISGGSEVVGAVLRREPGPSLARISPVGSGVRGPRFGQQPDSPAARLRR